MQGWRFTAKNGVTRKRRRRKSKANKWAVQKKPKDKKDVY